MTNKEKFLELVSETNYDVLEKNKWRIENRSYLRESKRIAMKVLVRLDELNWSKDDLAREANISIGDINEIVRGKKIDTTLTVLVKLQKTLDIPILATYNDPKYTNSMWIPQI